MSLGSAIGAAISGLSVSSRLAGVVSTNVSNALTPGYVRRTAEVAALLAGGEAAGVTVESIGREVKPHLLGERRGAGASAAAAEARTAFLQAVETALGAADSADSLTGSAASFEAALIAAASRPESQTQLATVLEGAEGLVAQLNRASDTIQDQRVQADAAIAGQVSQLNTALAQVADLNAQIRIGIAAGRDTNDLQDLRQKTVDSISVLMPLREYARDGGAIALYSTSGATLVEGRAAVFGFERTGAIDAASSLAAGTLSGLTLDGRAITTGEASMIAGGSLAENFAIRDDLAPALQANLDAVARNLVERLAAPGLDPSRAAGDAGLFTDAGNAFDPADEIGLAARIAVTAVVDPDRGGALWRLRDGLGAVAAGNAGDAGLLSALATALSASATAASGSAFSAGQRSFAGFASDMVAEAAARRVSAEDDTGFANARLTALQDQEAADGVDTDQELQALTLIEQSYAANARVLQVLDDLMQTIMEL